MFSIFCAPPARGYLYFAAWFALAGFVRRFVEVEVLFCLGGQ